MCACVRVCVCACVRVCVLASHPDDVIGGPARGRVGNSLMVERPRRSRGGGLAAGGMTSSLGLEQSV